MIVKKMYKFLKNTEDPDFKTHNLDYDIDIGCGFCIIYFSRPFHIDEIRAYCSSFVAPYMCYQPMTFDHYQSMFLHYGLDMSYDFLKNQYKQFPKIFGGNHFIEYGKTSDKRYYILIHSGSNGIANEMRNYDFDRVRKFCTKYAKLNRELIKSFFAYKNYSFIETFDQCHNQILNDKALLGFAPVDKDHGNIFAGGPMKKSYVIMYNGNKNLLVKHGCDATNKPSEDKNREQKDLDNYTRSFIPIDDYDFHSQGFSILRSLHPYFSKRPKNVH